MPRGFQGVRKVSAELEARRNSAGPNALWFRLDAEEQATVRFLEQDDDIFWCYVHEVPVEGRSFGRDVNCCDQENSGNPCPGCERDLPRKYKGYINLIWDQAPVFKRDSDGRMIKGDDKKPIVVGRKPQVAVWGSGIRLFEELDEVNANYRGLRSRRFKVKRKGEKLNTKYSIAPENVDSGPQEFTSTEKELEAKKYDLNEFVKALSYDEFLKELGEVSSTSNGHTDTPAAEARSRNPFMRRNQ